MSSLINSVGGYFSRMLNKVAVESVSKSKEVVGTRELISNLKKHVIAEERWEIPLETKDDGVADQLAERQGVVVALEDGQTRYLVRRIPNDQKEGVVDVIVTYASHMESNWVRVGEKQVENATLEDYLDQGEDKKDKTEGHLAESEDKKESTDVNQVRIDNKEDSTEGHSNQFEDKMDSSEEKHDSEDTASKI